MPLFLVLPLALCLTALDSAPALGSQPPPNRQEDAHFEERKGALHSKAWATFDGMPDPGTKGTPYRYSVSTAGVILSSSKTLLVNVYGE